MGDKTAISWTHHTQNFWVGCKKKSPGCAHCYMFAAMKRFGGNPLVIRRTKTWGDPLKWNARCRESGVRDLVFCCSWSDFFIQQADPWRTEAWSIIRACEWLDWQILTKEAERIADNLPADWGDGWPHVALGVSVENPRFQWRVDILRKIPARLRFVSAEPLLAPLPNLDLSGIHQLIVGGESGPGFRPMLHDWARELLAKARAAGTAYFFKQSASLLPGREDRLDGIEYKELPARTPPPFGPVLTLV